MRYVQKIQNYGTNKMSLLNQLKQNKFFWFGLFLKTIAIVILAPEIQNKWFLNFISFTIENFSLNPWNDFVESGADPMSYPYGPTMLIMHLPLSFCGYLIDNLNFASNAKNYFLSLGLKSSILIADLCILFLLVQLIKKKNSSNNHLLLALPYSSIHFILAWAIRHISNIIIIAIFIFS